MNEQRAATKRVIDLIEALAETDQIKAIIDRYPLSEIDKATRVMHDDIIRVDAAAAALEQTAEYVILAEKMGRMGVSVYVVRALVEDYTSYKEPRAKLRAIADKLLQAFRCTRLQPETARIMENILIAGKGEVR